MDFFEHQQRARKRTVLLVILYITAVVVLIGAVYALVVAIAAMTGGDQYAEALERNMFFDPTLLPLVVGGVSLLVLGGSFFKTAQLASGGGRAVAEMMGGRQIAPGTYDPAERRLYNVVEEMALAAGVPVPTIYIMDNEHGINAFAAGFSPNEAVIGVNRGTVDLLTRDELQGVIAHEFSHILNGDMRMNLRLIGVLFGLQLLALVGYYCMRMSYYASLSGGSRRSSNDNSSGAGLAMVMLLGGIGVMVIGYVGIFFSSVIKAAISRQREFLADASAVQFTRNPDGIAGALKKIGCPNVGSEIANEHAAEASHLFFGNVCQMFSLGNLLATHPDLTVRIQRIDPRFNGKFPTRIEPINFQAEARTPKPAPTYGLEKLNPAGVIDKIGQFDSGKVVAAAALLDTIPQNVSDAARNPLTAKATFYAMLLDEDDGVRQRQIGAIAQAETDFVVRQTRQIFGQMYGLTDDARIPLAQRLSSSLRQLTVDQYRLFSKVVDMLIAADQKMDVFEYTLKAILLRDLDIFFGLAKKLSIRYATVDSVADAVIGVLSYLAYMGHGTSADALAAFEASIGELDLDVSMLPVSESTVKRFDQSLRILAETSPELKKRIFSALMTCIQHDGQITVKEGELIRAIAAMLAIPMPVF